MGRFIVFSTIAALLSPADQQHAAHDEHRGRAAHRPEFSFRTTVAITAENSTLVSRRAATTAIGATVIAQMAIQ